MKNLSSSEQLGNHSIPLNSLYLSMDRGQVRRDEKSYRDVSASATFVVPLHVRIRRVGNIFNSRPNQRHGRQRQPGIAGRQFRKQLQFSARRRVVHRLRPCDRWGLDSNTGVSQF